jgi:hypothetical protein
MFISFSNQVCFKHARAISYKLQKDFYAKWHTLIVATPLWPSVGVKPNTPKVGDLESSGTPECLEFDSKAQNTSSDINT